MLYNKAFFKHDESRRAEFLAKLQAGEAKINAGVLFPHDIISQYGKFKKIDETLEELWKNQTNRIINDENILVIRDGSGSMTCTIGRTNTTCLNVADALTLYFSEKIKGNFHNNFITFSSKPEIVKLNDDMNLYEKLRYLRGYHDYTNTDLFKVFKLILDTAVKNKLEQKDLPGSLLIISDMEFDSACSVPNVKLFDTIKEMFAEKNYLLPKLIFWNVCSKSNTIPVIKNELGVNLVSGFSTAAIDMVLANEVAPLKALLKILNGERYAPIFYTE